MRMTGPCCTLLIRRLLVLPTRARQPLRIDQGASISSISSAARTRYACYYFPRMPARLCMNALAGICDHGPLTRIRFTGFNVVGHRGPCKWSSRRSRMTVARCIPTSGATAVATTVSQRPLELRWACHVGLDPYNIRVSSSL